MLKVNALSLVLLLSVLLVADTVHTSVLCKVGGAYALVTMVVQPHLTLTLEALGPGGVVLPLEQKVLLWSALSDEPVSPTARVCVNSAQQCRSCSFGCCAGDLVSLTATQASKSRTAKFDPVG